MTAGCTYRLFKKQTRRLEERMLLVKQSALSSGGEVYPLIGTVCDRFFVTGGFVFTKYQEEENDSGGALRSSEAGKWKFI